MSVDPLISAALLGATRLQALPPAAAPEWQATWDAISLDDPAQSLLQALALSRTAHLAGRRTSEAAEAGEPCPDEQLPELEETAISALLRMLRGEFKEALPEWLEATSGGGHIVPARVLPELLEAGRSDRSLRPALAQLMGKRGRWIAQRHSSFQWLLEDQVGADADWDADHIADRLAWLRGCRQQAPEQAAAAIAETWAGESPDFRQAIVQISADDPLPTDASWLETLALKERRKETKRLATAALMQLSGQPFAERAIERLKPLIKIEGNGRNRRLLIETPSAFEPKWTTDGLIAKPPGGSGEKAWWLRQIVAMVPLAKWPELLGVTEKELLALPCESDWKDAMLLGWIDSAKEVPTQALPSLLLPILASTSPWPKQAGSKPQVLASLISAIPQWGAMLEQLAGVVPEAELIQLLLQVRRAPDTMGATVKAVVRRTVARKPSTLNRPEARLLALCIPPTEIQSELEALAQLPDLTTSAEEFATTLEFRRSLFTNNPAQP